MASDSSGSEGYFDAPSAPPRQNSQSFILSFISWNHSKRTPEEGKRDPMPNQYNKGARVVASGYN